MWKVLEPSLKDIYEQEANSTDKFYPSKDEGMSKYTVDQTEDGTRR